MIRYEALWSEAKQAWAVMEWIADVGKTLELCEDSRMAEAACYDYALIHAFGNGE